MQPYIDKRDAGAGPFERARQPRLIDPILVKIEELVERSSGHAVDPDAARPSGRSLVE